MSFTPDSEVRVKELEHSDWEMLRSLQCPAPEAQPGQRGRYPPPRWPRPPRLWIEKYW
jgi:hypothetical protein